MIRVYPGQLCSGGRLLALLLLAASAHSQSIFSGVTHTDLVQTVQLTGKFHGRTAKAYHLMGRRAGFTSTSVLNDVKEFDNAVALIPTLVGNEALEIVSTSVNDTGAGSGAQQVKVVYIDNSNNLTQSAAITLNGLTPVAAGFTANEILWMSVQRLGTAQVSAGNIILRTVTGSTPLEQITAGGNRSLSARFMIPTGYTGYLFSWEVHAINADQDLRIRATVDQYNGTLLAGIYHFYDNSYLASNTNSFTHLPFIPLPALARIKVSTISAATGANARADASFCILLIANQ